MRKLIRQVFEFFCSVDKMASLLYEQWPSYCRNRSLSYLYTETSSRQPPPSTNHSFYGWPVPFHPVFMPPSWKGIGWEHWNNQPTLIF